MRIGYCALLLIGAHAAAGAGTATDAPAATAGPLAAFNQALIGATRQMDNGAAAALWEADGISLLPGTAPLVGRRAIRAYMDSVTAQMPGATMQRFELRCAGQQVSGSWASEWCLEHQVVDLGSGKPPFDGWGHLLLVLHRAGDGRWRLSREMWNQAEPQTAPDTPAR